MAPTELKTLEGLLASCNEYALAEHVGGSEVRKRARELVSRMAHVLGSLQPLVEPLSGSIPCAGAAVGACAVVIKLERTRKENSQHIVTVCNAMINMLAALRHLNPTLKAPAGRYPAALFSEIEGMSVSIQNFGAFADTYYTRYARKVVRFILSRDINCRLQSHVKSFHEHERKISSLLAIHTTVTVEQIYVATERILQKLDDAEMRASAPAAKVLHDSGGEDAVRKNPSLVDKVAHALGDDAPVQPETYKTLTEDIEELLNQQRSAFEAKVLSAKDEIIMRLTQGPHDLLVDEDVKEVWRVNNWRLSVKYRVFVDCLHTHFESEAEKEKPADPWALKVLSKVINHPAIGEAIDEDSSGFLSINEVNQFLSCKPARCSTPAWFAFWAVGWRYMNVLYAVKINHLLTEIKKRCLSLTGSGCEPDVAKGFHAYLEIITRVGSVNGWVDHSGNDTGDDVFGEVDDDAKAFSIDLAQYTEEKLLGNLDRLEFMVKDSCQLQLVLLGVTTRIEQVLMLLLNLILAKHLEILSSDFASRKSRAETLHHMSNGLDEILKELSTRLRALIRSWKSQKLDVEVQISCYAGGLLYGWYMHITEDTQEKRKLLRSDSMRSPSFSRFNSGNEHSQALADRMTAMEERLSKMDEKIDNILLVLSTLEGLRVSAHTAPSHR